MIPKSLSHWMYFLFIHLYILLSIKLSTFYLTLYHTVSLKQFLLPSHKCVAHPPLLGAIMRRSTSSFHMYLQLNRNCLKVIVLCLYFNSTLQLERMKPILQICTMPVALLCRNFIYKQILCV